VVLVFKGTTLSALNLVPVDPVAGPKNPPAPDELSFEINTKATPKTLDYWRDPAMKIQALYELKGDELSLAIPRNGSSCGVEQLPRPKGFSTTEDRCMIVLVLRRTPTAEAPQTPTAQDSTDTGKVPRQHRVP
jgi:hypothetical protein